MVIYGQTLVDASAEEAEEEEW
jgi:hypothetical protein